MEYPFQRGSLSLVVGGAIATLIVAIYGVVAPDRQQMTGALVIVILGVGGTWRNYLKWRGSRGRRLVH